ncbi:sulfite:cytochrome C oxidoreductase subunit b precursor [Methylobacterium radiotolerans]|uniref:Sulfite:cytochrome C oxidoreductase subunit b n=1 Tax=Methylobacterium oryzae TaxID=334852 RepID=A0ABU7TKI2_9HYPH
MSLTHIARCLSALALLPAPALAGPPPEPMRFTSQLVELPGSDRVFPPGPGAEAVNNTCLACHSAGMVLTQPALTRAQWSGIVDKMIHSYRAPVDPADRQAIIDYLAALRPQP